MQTKLASKLRGNGVHRTGQTLAAQAQANAMANGSNGPACGPMAPTVPMSWGAGCPPGGCTGADLAASLGRAFAGERYPCRELPYWLAATSDAGGIATFSQNSLVTICPTRVLVLSSAADGDLDAVMSEFTVGNQNQVVGDPLPIRFLHPQSYQIIPFVTDCIKAGMPFRIVITGNTAATDVYVGLIGPAIG